MPLHETTDSFSPMHLTAALKSKMPRARGAIVIGGSYRALGIIRNLARHRVPSWVLLNATDDDLLAVVSRHTLRTLWWPCNSDRQRIDFLLEAGRKYDLDGWVLIPTDDESAALLAKHHGVLSERFRVSVPPWDILQWAYDKRLTYRLAQRLNVAHPLTSYPKSRQDLIGLTQPFPLILKPAFKEELNALTAAKAWCVEDRASLLARYDEACALVNPDTLVIQEIVPGSGQAQFSYAALVQDGRPLASLVARRVRQIPRDFGRFSTYVETTNETAVIEPAERLLAAIRFSGLVEVEFKRDCRDGQYKLLDINPRIWGWYTLCPRAGVDFGHMLWQMLHNDAVQSVSARVGVRWMRTGADITVAASEMLRGRLTLSAYLRSVLGPVERAIFALRDPLPGFVSAPLLAYKFGRRALTQIVPRSIKSRSIESLSPAKPECVE